MLKDTHPHLILEIHPTKNENINVNLLHTYSNKKIWWQCNKGHEWEATIDRRSRGDKCPYCQNKKVCLNNCLAFKKPSLIKEWHTKNSITPYDVLPRSRKKVWWKCEKNHEWQASIDSRHYHNCPVCVNQLIIKENSLEQNNALLCIQWDYGKNTKLPSQVSIGSSYKAWWKCASGHSWLAAVNDRKTSNGICPHCRHENYLKTNSFGAKCPDLIFEWDQSKNGLLTPFNTTKCSKKNIHWICSKNHKWISSPKSRVKGSSCPYCHKYVTQTLIFNIIQKALINQKIEYNFKHEGLRFKSGRKMELDIFIPNFNLAIEYQGEHHFFVIHGEKELRSCQIRDEEKRKACKKYGVKLIEINYNDPINEEYIYSLIKDYV